MRRGLFFVFLFFADASYGQTMAKFTTIQQNNSFNIAKWTCWDNNDSSQFRSFYTIQFIDKVLFDYTDIDTVCEAINKLCKLYKDSIIALPSFLQIEEYAPNYHIPRLRAFFDTKERIYTYYYYKRGKEYTKKKKITRIHVDN